MALITKEESAEVIYADEAIVTVDREFLGKLSERSRINPRGKVRLCAHGGVEHLTQEMLISYTKDTYVHPHKQYDKSVSYHIVSGVVDIILFSDEGDEVDRVEMGAYNSGLPFYFRAPANIYRTMLVKSENLLFHEVATGPFKKEDTIFAPWAPKDVDQEEIKMFKNTLSQGRRL